MHAVFFDGTLDVHLTLMIFVENRNERARIHNKNLDGILTFIFVTNSRKRPTMLWMKIEKLAAGLCHVPKRMDPSNKHIVTIAHDSIFVYFNIAQRFPSDIFTYRNCARCVCFCFVPWSTWLENKKQVQNNDGLDFRLQFMGAFHV